VVISIVIIGGIVLAAGFWFGLRRLLRRPTPQERAARTYQAAAGQVDGLLAQARIRMEEAAG